MFVLFYADSEKRTKRKTKTNPKQTPENHSTLNKMIPFLISHFQ